MYNFYKKYLWYLATVCGFTFGLEIAGWFVSYYEPSTYLKYWWAALMEIYFWAFLAVGAGLGMGFAQWILISRVHKNAILWIPVTTIGIVGITGGSLLLILVIGAFFQGAISEFFGNFADWFVPWVKVLTILSPIAIIMGPALQWLMVRHFAKNQSFKEFLEMSMGWISAFVIICIMFGLLGSLLHIRSEILNIVISIVATIPSGLIFAYSTRAIIRKPQSESSAYY